MATKKKNDSAVSRQSKSPRKLAEILVEPDQDPAFGNGALQQHSIGTARGIRSCPGYIVSGDPQHGKSYARKILVRKKPHHQAIAAGYTFSD